MSNLLVNHIASAAAQVDAEAPSTSKWKAVRDLIAEALVVQEGDVYVVTVSKPGNLKVRIEQSAAARAAPIIVAMCNIGSGHDVLGTVRSAEARVAEGRDLALVFDEAAGWSLQAIVKRAGDSVPAALASAYPSATVFDV